MNHTAQDQNRATESIPYCWAIETRYHGATNNRGSRVSADRLSQPGRHRWTAAYKDELSSGTNHRLIAEKAMAAIAPTGTWKLSHRFATPRGQAFIFVDA